MFGKIRKLAIRVVSIIGVVLLAIIILALPVFAITNPDVSVTFGSGAIPLYRVFENVVEDGDMLFVAEVLVDYTPPPVDYPDASDTYLFDILDITGTITYISIPLNSYGNRPISIYLSALQVGTIGGGLVSNTAYGLRITGNPLVTFTSPPATNTTVVAYLTPGKYIDQLLGEDGGVPENNPLRNFLIDMAENIEDYDGVVYPDEYIVTVQGTRYLTLIGGSIFLEGIPSLGTFAPTLFQVALESVSGDEPESTGAYESSLNPTLQWGTTVGNGLTNFGVYLGISQALAGSVVLFALAIAFGIYVYQKTESGMATLLLLAATPFLGAWLGLMPLALAFVFVIFIIVLLGYFFFSRGAL